MALCLFPLAFWPSRGPTLIPSSGILSDGTWTLPLGSFRRGSVRHSNPYRQLELLVRGVVAVIVDADVVVVVVVVLAGGLGWLPLLCCLLFRALALLLQAQSRQEHVPLPATWYPGVPYGSIAAQSARILFPTYRDLVTYLHFPPLSGFHFLPPSFFYLLVFLYWPEPAASLFNFLFFFACRGFFALTIQGLAVALSQSTPGYLSPLASVLRCTHDPVMIAIDIHSCGIASRLLFSPFL